MISKRVHKPAPHRTSALTFLLVLAFFVLSPGSAMAHGGLKSSAPRRGEVVKRVLREIRLDFTERPELAVTSVRVTSAEGAVVDLSRPKLSGNSIIVPLGVTLSNGRYNVTWKTAGRDGHPVSGTFSFEVSTPNGSGAASVPPKDSVGVNEPMPPMEMHHDTLSLPSGNGFNAESPIYAVIRFVQFVALVILLGAFAFRFVVLGMLRRRNKGSPLLDRTSQPETRIVLTAASILLLVGVARLVAQAYAMHSADESMFGPMIPMIAGTRWGIGWILQIVGAVVVLAALAMVQNERNGWRAATVGAAALAYSPALSGHAASAPHLAALAVFFDGLHVVGASGWLGSLFVVIAAGMPAALRLDEDQKHGAVADLINAFSPTALVFASLAGVTGIFAGWLHIGSFNALITTNYGRTLLVKLGILSLVAATGAYNWLRIRPRLGKSDGTTLINRTARAELAIALLVLAVTAVLVATPTAVDEELMQPAAAPFRR